MVIISQSNLLKFVFILKKKEFQKESVPSYDTLIILVSSVLRS